MIDDPDVVQVFNDILDDPNSVENFKKMLNDQSSVIKMLTDPIIVDAYCRIIDCLKSIEIFQKVLNDRNANRAFNKIFDDPIASSALIRMLDNQNADEDFQKVFDDKNAVEKFNNMLEDRSKVEKFMNMFDDKNAVKAFKKILETLIAFEKFKIMDKDQNEIKELKAKLDEKQSINFFNSILNSRNEIEEIRKIIDTDDPIEAFNEIIDDLNIIETFVKILYDPQPTETVIKIQYVLKAIEVFEKLFKSSDEVKEFKKIFDNPNAISTLYIKCKNSGAIDTFYKILNNANAIEAFINKCKNPKTIIEPSEVFDDQNAVDAFNKLFLDQSVIKVFQKIINDPKEIEVFKKMHDDPDNSKLLDDIFSDQDTVNIFRNMLEGGISSPNIIEHYPVREFRRMLNSHNPVDAFYKIYDDRNAAKMFIKMLNNTSVTKLLSKLFDNPNPAETFNKINNQNPEEFSKIFEDISAVKTFFKMLNEPNMTKIFNNILDEPDPVKAFDDILKKQKVDIVDVKLNDQNINLIQGIFKDANAVKTFIGIFNDPNSVSAFDRILISENPIESLNKILNDQKAKANNVQINEKNIEEFQKLFNDPNVIKTVFRVLNNSNKYTIFNNILDNENPFELFKDQLYKLNEDSIDLKIDEKAFIEFWQIISDSNNVKKIFRILNRNIDLIDITLKDKNIEEIQKIFKDKKDVKKIIEMVNDPKTSNTFNKVFDEQDSIDLFKAKLKSSKTNSEKLDDKYVEDFLKKFNEKDLISTILKILNNPNESKVFHGILKMSDPIKAFDEILKQKINNQNTAKAFHKILEENMPMEKFKDILKNENSIECFKELFDDPRFEKFLDLIKSRITIIKFSKIVNDQDTIEAFNKIIDDRASIAAFKKLFAVKMTIFQQIINDQTPVEHFMRILNSVKAISFLYPNPNDQINVNMFNEILEDKIAVETINRILHDPNPLKAFQIEIDDKSKNERFNQILKDQVLENQDLMELFQEIFYDQSSIDTFKTIINDQVSYDMFYTIFDDPNRDPNVVTVDVIEIFQELLIDDNVLNILRQVFSDTNSDIMEAFRRIIYNRNLIEIYKGMLDELNAIESFEGILDDKNAVQIFNQELKDTYVLEAFIRVLDDPKWLKPESYLDQVKILIKYLHNSDIDIPFSIIELLFADSQSVRKQLVDDPSFLIDEYIKNVEYCYPEFYTDLFICPDGIKYYTSESIDMGNFSSVIPFPKIIATHYSAARFKATFGCFTEIRRFYCTIDNKLFLWSFDAKEPQQHMEEESIFICCACLCGVDLTLLDYAPYLRYTLVVATPKYIKIFGISGPDIDFSQFYLTEINFAPSCIAPGPNGQIFVGSDCGRIFLLRFDDAGVFKVSSIAYSYSPIDFTYGIFPRLLRILVGYSSPSIIQIVFDPTYSYIAAIDNQNHLRFFNYEPKSCNCTILAFKNSEKYEVVSVCAVSTDPVQPQFIAFCKDGTRLLIKKRSGLFLAFTVVSQKPPPPEFGKDELMVAQSFMGLTVMIGKKRACFIRGQRYQDENKRQIHVEFVSSENLAGTGLSIGVVNSDPYWNDPLVWQHNREPPIVFILTASGGYKYRFYPPSEQLQRLVTSSRGLMTDEISEHLEKSCADFEPVSDAILASFYHVGCEDWLIYLITQYAHSKCKESSLIIDGIIVRISRILEPFWELKLFGTYTSRFGKIKWHVEPSFLGISPILIKQLEHTKSWMSKYMQILKSNNQTPVTATSRLILREQNAIQSLTSFVSTIIEILTFLGYFSHQKKQLVTELMFIFSRDKELKKQFEYLTDIEFGQCLQNMDDFLYALRSLSHILFTKMQPSTELDTLGHQLIDSCPSIASSKNSEYQVYEALNRFCQVELTDLTIQEKKTYFPLIVNPFIEYAEHVSTVILNQVVTSLVRMDGIPFAISIIEAKVRNIDPSNRAIQFYDRGFKNADDDEDQDVGKKLYFDIFDFLQQPLGIIRNEPNGVDSLMKSKLKIVHVMVFFELLNSSNPRQLLSLDSPYIIEFLTNFKKDYLWKYYHIHNRKDLVYKEIKKMYSYDEKGKAPESEVEFNDKIQMLQIALRYARNSNATIEEIDSICKSIDDLNNAKKLLLKKEDQDKQKEEEEMRKLFNEIDKDGNGTLDREELLIFFKGDQSMVDHIFNEIEDNKEALTYEDLKYAKILFNLRKLFESLLDKNDKKGALGKKQLEEFYEKGKISPPMPLNEFIERNDSDHDGKLDFYEATIFI